MRLKKYKMIFFGKLWMERRKSKPSIKNTHKHVTERLQNWYGYIKNDKLLFWEIETNKQGET